MVAEAAAAAVRTTGESFDESSVVAAVQHFAYAAVGECFVFVAQVAAAVAANFERVAWKVAAVDVAYILDRDPENHHVFVGSADVEAAEDW